MWAEVQSRPQKDHKWSSFRGNTKEKCESENRYRKWHWSLKSFYFFVVLEHLDLTNESINDEKKLFTISDGFAPHAAVYIEQLKQIAER